MRTATRKNTGNGWIGESRLFLVNLLTMVLLVATHATCFASSIVLQWDADTDPNVTGYKVYYQADSATQPFQGTGATQGAAPLDVQSLTTATITGLDPAHAYYFAVAAYNASGVESSYSNIASIPELTPPTVSLSSPITSTTVSGTVSVNASASDNVGVTKVEFYVNGVLKATDTATPYVYSWNTAGLASGNYTLQAKAYDAAGNVGQSGVVSVTVAGSDTTAPTVSVTSPATGAVVSGTVTIAATASDNVGVSSVEFYENGALLYAANTAPYSYSWNTTSIANGSYTLSAKAYDASGNIGQSSNVSVTVNNVVADTTAPTVSSFSIPATATSLTVAISSFTASDNVGVAGYLVTESSTAPSASASGWSSTAPTSFTFSAAGSKTAYAWAKDAAGNVSAAKNGSVTITLPDTTAPTVSITAPAAGVTVGGTVSVTASASDNVGVSKVEFYANNVLQSSSSAAPYSFSWNTASVANGSYSLSAKAYDAAGNVGQSANILVTVNNAATSSAGTLTAVFGNASGSNYPNTVEDTFLNINTDVNAANVALNTYTWPANTPANAILMKWDVSALPANAQIQSATLNLNLISSGGDTSYQIPVSEIINKQPVIAKSTGYTYDGTNPWTASSVPYGGVPLAQSDIAPAADAPLIDQTNGYKSWNVTSIVKDWVANPGNNMGLLLNSSSLATSDSSRTFASSEAVDATQRPQLVVTYTLSSDTTAPTVGTFTMPATATSQTVAIASFTASDNVGVTGYLVTESATAPSASATGWSASAPTSFTFSAAGSKTAYAWAKDAAGNVSAAKSSSVAITLPDTTPPTVGTFTMPTTATSLTVAISSFTASDNVGVTGYLVTESATAPSASATGWSANAPTSFTFSAAGSKTAYAWAMDVAGNVSAAKSSSVTITLPDTTAPTVGTFTMPATATSLTVAISSFTASDNVGVTGYLVTESATAPSASATGWSASAPTSFTFSAAGSTTAYAWAMDAAGNVSAAKSSSVAITLPDTTPPTVTISSPVSGSKVGSKVTIKASASDNVAVTNMQLYIDNVLKVTSSSSTINWTWNTSSYSRGSHVILVKAYDAANNSGSQSITVTK
ncbi:Ig-like domain-containing protein [Oryzomonas rubra]|uniref:DNRLRE domain-containing protein n=1 Tax=Oryzomonas rubra TaxID=2509454 RepID=A0A5A9XCI4_9BACT|nr:Ig-like domain-containing protein [Oryzomonas rubra]KAA0890514.1 DNRLRE domain-containing protein [Oryzomonas rubra]